MAPHRVLAILVASALAVSALAVVPGPVRAADVGAAARVLVRFAPGATTDERAAVARAVGGSVDARIDPLGVTRIAVPATADVTSATRRIERLPGVLWAETDALVSIGFTPNDPLYDRDPYTGLGQWGLRKAGVDRAWDVVRGSPDVIVATVDTGVDPGHPDLAGAVLPGVSFLSAVNPICPGQTNDDSSHGTHVAGVIAAKGNNGLGIAGVAFGVRILPLKALDCTGAGASSDVAAATVYAVDHGARIINISLGSTSPSQTVQDAVDYARRKNVLVVAAAGNCGQPAPECPVVNQQQYPAAYPGVLAVAATNPDDTHAAFSNQGSYVGIAAPGSRIVSTTPTYPTYLSARGATTGYAAFSGTSSAAPFVSGVAALLLSKEPGLTAAELAARLRATADDLGTQGSDPSFGAGRVNAFRAVTAAAPAATAFGVTYGTAAVPPAAAVGARFNATLRLTNASSFTWPASGAGAVGVGYRWLDASGKVVVPDGLRTPLVRDIAVGATDTVSAPVVAPNAIGVYLLRFDLFRDGAAFSTQGAPTGDVVVTVTPGYGAAYAPRAPSATLVIGTPVVLNVTVTNTGLRTWPAAGAKPVHLSYHWLAPDSSIAVWEGARAVLPQDVEPGASATMALPVTPPARTGPHTLRLDLVEEGVTWFSAQGVPTGDVPFNVTSGLAASFTLGAAIPTLLPGGRFNLPITIRNDGLATWNAFGPSPVHLAAHLFDVRGNLVLWDGARSALAADVSPGATANVNVIVDAPLSPGTYRVQPDLVQEGVAWLSGFGSQAAPTLVAVVSDYRAILPAGPLTVSRATPRATVTVANTSSVLWSATGDAPISLSAHWLDASGATLVWDGPRTPLGRDLASGDVLTLSVSLGPVPNGAAAVVIDLVSEGVRWFDVGPARAVNLVP